MNSVINSIINALSGTVPKWVIIFLVSMIPLLELRGSIIAAGFMDVTFLPTYVAAVIGNLVPIPFILFFITRIFDAMKKTKHLGRVANKLEQKALSKRSQIDKYGFFGLFLFVAIPLPGTGAWTGALLSVLLGMKPAKSFLFIAFGVMAAGLVMSLLSFGIIKSIV